MKKVLLFLITCTITSLAIAQVVGDKVHFVAVDGKTYIGIIREIKGSQYKVRYDGYNFDAWLTSGTFTVMNVSVPDGYKIWVKTSPCSGRFDWIAVAKENPANGGGGGAWMLAEQIFFTTGMACTKVGSSCSFDAANAEAEILRRSDVFFKYCCRNYSVWKNSQTGAMTIVLGQGSPGFGWMTVPGGANLCCEEAEALAGIPGACSANQKLTNGQTTACWPGSYAAVDPQTGKTECFCKPGLVWNSTKTACVDPKTLSPDDLVKSTACWPGTHAAWDAQTKTVQCYCNPGLVWNSTKTACVDPQELVRNADCSAYSGSRAVWNSQAQRVECQCPPGKKFNQTMTACIDDNSTGNNNNGTNTNGDNGNNNGNSSYTCSSSDQAEFAKITGNWKSSVMLLTISGSCSNVTGTFTTIEWCDGLEWDATKNAQKLVGTIKGSMHGQYLQVHYKSPPSPHNSKGSEGDGSCHLQADGTLNCDFGCSDHDLKRN